jgi:hypothetical protein
MVSNDYFEGIIKGFDPTAQISLFGTTTKTEETTYTYSPSSSLTYTYSPQTTTTTTTNETITYAPKKTTYYAPVLMYNSPYASASPRYSENAPLSIIPTANPYLTPYLSTETRTAQPQITTKTATTNDETMKWILIGGALLLAFLFLMSKIK